MSSFLESANVNSTTAVDSTSPTQSLDSLPTDEFLRVVGMRVRTQRSARSMSRKKLAEVSGVSERYLAQLESGQGNMSIALLRKVTTAIDLSLAKLLSAEMPELLDSAGGDQINNMTAETSIPKTGYSRESAANSKSRMIAEH